MKLARIVVQRQGGKQTVAAIRNTGGCFLYIKSDASRHRKSKLIIRRDLLPDVVLNGRQLSSLRKVLTAI